MGQPQKRAARVMTHPHVLADLDKVGKMGADMEQMLPPPVIHLVRQEFDIYGFDDPRFRVQFFGGPAHQFIAGILRRKSIFFV